MGALCSRSKIGSCGSDLALKASRGKLTVRQLERMATRRSRGRGQQTQVETYDPNRQAALDELQKHIGTRVTLHMPTKGHAGQLILEFYDEEQLNGLYETPDELILHS